MKKVDNIEQLHSLINKFFLRKTLTNNYLLTDSYEKFINDGKLYYVSSESNVGLLVRKQDFFRLYYMLNNPEENIQINCDLPIVTEIIYRGINNQPNAQFEYWLKHDFRMHLTRDNMICSYDGTELPDSVTDELLIKYASTKAEILYTKKIIDESLDKFTGDILSFEEVTDFALNNCILIAYSDNQPAGILQFDIKNSVVWLGHICVDSNFRGKGIAKALVKRYFRDNFQGNLTKYQLWVLNDNQSALALYNRFGFTYANKSTTSLLKL